MIDTGRAQVSMGGARRGYGRSTWELTLRVTRLLWTNAGPQAISFTACLPSMKPENQISLEIGAVLTYLELEVTDGEFRIPASVVFGGAENWDAYHQGCVLAALGE